MLEANKNRLFGEIFAVYNRNLFKRRFYSFNVAGLNNLTGAARKPLVIYANHSSWWDGLVVYEICRRARLDFYVMMEEKQLKNLPLFRRLGAFSVVRENPREAVKSINYAVRLLKEKLPKTLLIFPQGEIQPNDVRPLGFYNGLARIVEKTGECSAISLAIRYEFLSEFKPEIYVKIAAARPFSGDEKFDAKTLTTTFSKNLTEALDNLKNDITNKETDDYMDIIR